MNIDIIKELSHIRPDLEWHSHPMGHGLVHWLNVYSYAEILSGQEGVDKDVVAYFAFFHDCERFDNSEDLGHGRRAETTVLKYGDKLNMTPQQLDMLCEACRRHTYGFKSDNMSIGACWDSDRLDLCRLPGRVVDPFMLHSDKARSLIGLRPDLGKYGWKGDILNDFK